MMNKRKKCFAMLAVFGCFWAMGTTSQAGTIPFTICVNGSDPDTLSKKEIKANDGDRYAYFTLTKYTDGNSPVSVSSYSYKNSSVHSASAILREDNRGVVQKRLYNTTAPGGVYYFMEAGQNPLYPRTKMEGKYCP